MCSVCGVDRENNSSFARSLSLSHSLPALDEEVDGAGEVWKNFRISSASRPSRTLPQPITSSHATPLNADIDSLHTYACRYTNM